MRAIYTKEEVTKDGPIYDVVFDTVGKISSSQAKNLLKENRAFLNVQSTTREELENLVTLRELAEAGKVKAVIDKRFPLEAVARAHRYIETGRKKWNAVITVAP